MTRSLPRRAAGAMRAWPRPARWLTAELIPFGSLFIGMLVAWAGAPAVGFILAFIGTTVATCWYLNWVQDTHAAWALPLILLVLPVTVVGDWIFGHPISYGRPLIVTPGYWQVFGGLLAALAVTVALAVANGERHHGRYSGVVTRQRAR